MPIQSKNIRRDDEGKNYSDPEIKEPFPADNMFNYDVESPNRTDLEKKIITHCYATECFRK